MSSSGESSKEAIRPDFDRSIIGRANVENRIKEAKNTLRWDKTGCHRFAANQARPKMGALAYNLLHMVREFHLMGEDVKRSI